jgi:hypothetical protein
VELTRAPWDPANSLLAETQAQITAESVGTPDGPRTAVTVRTASTTVTVFLRKGNAIAAAEKIASEASKMPSLTLTDAMQEV